MQKLMAMPFSNAIPQRIKLYMPLIGMASLKQSQRRRRYTSQRDTKVVAVRSAIAR
jgi:hypothetical protein